MGKATVSELHSHQKYERLIAATKTLSGLPTAVAHPCDETALRGALEAFQAGMIIPILVGPKDKIRKVAKSHALALDSINIIDAPHSQAAAALSVELVRK